MELYKAFAIDARVICSAPAASIIARLFQRPSASVSVLPFTSTEWPELRMGAIAPFKHLRPPQPFLPAQPFQRLGPLRCDRDSLLTHPD